MLCPADLGTFAVRERSPFALCPSTKVSLIWQLRNYPVSNIGAARRRIAYRRLSGVTAWFVKASCLSGPGRRADGARRLRRYYTPSSWPRKFLLAIIGRTLSLMQNPKSLRNTRSERRGVVIRRQRPAFASNG